MHRERLWPGPLGWGAVVIFGVLAAIAFVPLGLRVAVVAAAVGLLLAGVLAVRIAALVEVRDGELRAGAAHVPLDLLGDVRLLDRAGLRHELGPALDARSFACLRAWIPTAIRVELLDPADPTPYWIVSTRHPEALAAAVRQGQQRPAERA